MRYYRFGCGSRPGHRYWSSDSQQVSGAKNAHLIVPWGWNIDSSRWLKPTNGKVRVEQLDGWTAVGRGDRTADSRPGSITVFVFEGLWSDYEAVGFVVKLFPETVKRMGGLDAFELDYRDFPV